MTTDTAKACERCGGPFNPRTPTARFCSNTCKMATLHDTSRGRKGWRKPSARTPRRCEECGETFTPQHPDTSARQARLCSRACRDRRRSRELTGSTWRKVTLDATTVPTDLDIAWAAGLWEGEGHCQARNKTQRVTISQNEVWVLERCRALFGGSIGCSEGRACSYWNINGQRARDFLTAVWPWLSPRRREQVLRTMPEGWTPPDS